jgi:hypothetical protein
MALNSNEIDKINNLYKEIDNYKESVTKLEARLEEALAIIKVQADAASSNKKAKG